MKPWELKQIAATRPDFVLNNSFRLPDENGRTSLDLLSYLPGAHGFIGPAGCRIKRKILQEKKNGREQRSLVVLAKGPGGECIVKQCAGSFEIEIASKAQELEIGPRLFFATEKIMVEEYIPGSPLSKMVYCPLSPRQLGAGLGILLSKLHLERIFYIDVLLPHIYVRDGGKLCLIDYGCASIVSSLQGPGKELTDFFSRRFGINFNVLPLEMILRTLSEHDLQHLIKSVKSSFFPLIPLWARKRKEIAVRELLARYKERMNRF